MYHVTRSGDGACDRVGVTYVAFDDIDAEAREIVPPTRRAAHRPYGMSGGKKRPNDSRSDKSGCAGDHYTVQSHRVINAAELFVDRDNGASSRQFAGMDCNC